jgi:fibronectin type 3 domain-containing protein
MISVDNDFHNEITWKYEEEVISYNIYREGVQSNQYDLLVNIPYESNNMWIDTSSNAASRSYQYKISAIDSCGNESPLSESHKTMHLTISQGVGNAWNLIWTPYEGATYQTYNIYRTSGDTTGIFELITTISSNNTSYTDNYTPNGYVYYMVEIVLDNPCSLKKALSSIRSNIATNKSTTQTAISETQTSLISVYPNPAMDNITVTLPENVPQAVFTLYDMQGKELIRQEVSNQDKVKVNGFAAGIYVYKVVTAKESYQGKIIIKD